MGPQRPAVGAPEGDVVQPRFQADRVANGDDGGAGPCKRGRYHHQRIDGGVVGSVQPTGAVQNDRIGRCGERGEELDVSFRSVLWR